MKIHKIPNFSNFFFSIIVTMLNSILLSDLTKEKQAFLHIVKIQYQHFAFIFLVIVFFAMFYNSNHQNCHISDAIMLKFCVQNVEHMCFIL